MFNWGCWSSLFISVQLAQAILMAPIVNSHVIVGIVITKQDVHDQDHVQMNTVAITVKVGLFFYCYRLWFLDLDHGAPFVWWTWSSHFRYSLFSLFSPYFCQTFSSFLHFLHLFSSNNPPSSFFLASVFFLFRCGSVNQCFLAFPSPPGLPLLFI